MAQPKKSTQKSSKQSGSQEATTPTPSSESTPETNETPSGTTTDESSTQNQTPGITSSSLSGDDTPTEPPADGAPAPENADETQGGDTDPQTPETAAEPLPGTSAVYENGVEVRSATLPDHKRPIPKATSGHTTAAPKGRILKESDEITFDADVKENFAIVKEDVYQEVTARGSARKTYRLVYTKGTRVPLSALKSKNSEG